MSTRSLIGIERSNGNCLAIYCHFDGYPTGVGLELARNYTTTKQVESLLSLGDISSLGNTLDTCVAYCRDRGEEYSAPELFKTRHEYFKTAQSRDTEYCYLFTLGTWIYADSMKRASEPEWRRADVAELDALRLKFIDDYCKERRRRLQKAGYDV